MHVISVCMHCARRPLGGRACVLYPTHETGAVGVKKVNWANLSFKPWATKEGREEDTLQYVLMTKCVGTPQCGEDAVTERGGRGLHSHRV